MTNRIWLVGTLLCFSLTGCWGRDSNDKHEHAGESPESADRTDTHGHGHGGGISITHYTGATELFVEFPPLVKGQEAAFAAHLTRLDPEGTGPDTAVSEGTLTVTLTGGEQPEERVSAGVSGTPGIFRPVLTPRNTGKRKLAFHLVAPGIDAVHEVGEAEVYPDARSAQGSLPAEEEGDASIGFTKEQQWKIDFATRPALERVVRESVAVTATIKPRASAEAVVAAPATGLINAGPDGFPRIGMQVARGHIFGYLAPQLGAESDASTLQLAVRRAQINVGRRQHELERLEGLLKEEAIAEKRVRDARSELSLAQAELRSAQDRIETYHTGRGGIALRAPIHGTVINVSGSPGGAVQAGQTLIHIADLKKLWLEARISESDLGRIKTPSGASFQVKGLDFLVLEVGRNARLIAFGGMVDAITRTVPAIFEFDNTDGSFKAGMHVQASLFTGVSERMVAIPASAVIDDNGQAVVFVQPEGESFERRPVVLGARDGAWVAIRSGIQAGERVATRGAYQVRLAASAPAALGHGHAH